VDLAFVAEQYPLSPGLIRNAVVRACLIASRRNPSGISIAMADLEQALLDEETVPPEEAAPAPPSPVRMPDY
jgi:hypothetical protein